MKRFTETTRWIDPWFRKLSPLAKLLWCYLCDNCDQAGIIELDIEAASFSIGGKVEESHVKELGDRIDQQGSKLLVRKFVLFQYGELTAECNAHKPAIASVEKHKLIKDSQGYRYPTDKEAEGLAKGIGRVGQGYHPNTLATLQLLNDASGKKFRETETNLSFISSRLYESGVTPEGVKQMILRQCKRWMGTEQSEYLRPETLFNKTKFDGYYASRDLPVTATKPPTEKYGSKNTVPGSVPNNGF